MISEAFARLSRYRWLALIPIVLDLVGLASMAGRFGPSATRLNFKLQLEPGLPSFLNLFDQSGGQGGITLNGLPVGHLAVLAVVWMIIMFLLVAFADAGFIGLLHEAAGDQPVTFDTFLRYGRGFWLRLLGIKLVIMLATFAVFGGLLLTLRFLGLIVGGALLIWFRVMYIYWEFTAVVEDLPLAEAFARSRQHYTNRGPQTAEAIWALLIANLAFGLLVGAMPALLLLLLLAVVYGYVLTALELALMQAYHEARAWPAAAA